MNTDLHRLQLPLHTALQCGCTVRRSCPDLPLSRVQLCSGLELQQLLLLHCCHIIHTKHKHFQGV